MAGGRLPESSSGLVFRSLPFPLDIPKNPDKVLRAVEPLHLIETI
jgi:hypothetical protein